MYRLFCFFKMFPMVSKGLISHAFLADAATECCILSYSYTRAQIQGIVGQDPSGRTLLIFRNLQLVVSALSKGVSAETTEIPLDPLLY